jgi:hypothetical protein
MEMERSLKEVVESRIQQKLGNGISSAQSAVTRLVNEDVIARDFIVNGITAHARTTTPERMRELQEVAGDLINRVKL